MYLCSSALIFFIDWDFSLLHMSMDLSSVLAALNSPMVPSGTGTNNQLASPHGCLSGLDGPEPSGPLINPGQHLQLQVSARGQLGPWGVPETSHEGAAEGTEDLVHEGCVCCLGFRLIADDG